MEYSSGWFHFLYLLKPVITEGFVIHLEIPFVLVLKSCNLVSPNIFFHLFMSERWSGFVQTKCKAESVLTPRTKGINLLGWTMSPNPNAYSNINALVQICHPPEP